MWFYRVFAAAFGLSRASVGALCAALDHSWAALSHSWAALGLLFTALWAPNMLKLVLHINGLLNLQASEHPALQIASAGDAKRKQLRLHKFFLLYNELTR
jgi:hypothetical protein